MNDINRETARQFELLAPEDVAHGGYLFKRVAALYDDETDTVRFDYVGRHQPGANFRDKVCVAVSYQGISDIYTIVIQAWDGKTEETTVLHSGEGHHSEDFMEVARWLF